jgi:lysophospholipase L1-like esterase
LQRDGGPALDEIEETYREIVEAILRERPDVVLVLTTLTPVRGRHEHLMPMIREFNGWLEALSEGQGLRLMDLHAPLSDGDGLLREDLTGDGIHFTDAAYAIWGAEIERVLMETHAPLIVPEDIAHWSEHAQARILEFRRENAALAAAAPEERHVILLGSSTMEGWKNADRIARFLPAGHRHLNRGISADRIGVGRFGILHRLDDSVFNCQPSHVVLQNGTNDLLVHAREGSPSVETIVETYERVVATIRERMPGVPIAIVTVQPLRGRYAIGNEATLEFNGRLREIAEARGCFLIDHFPMLVDEEGLLREDLTGDGLHFRDEGYRMMGEEIARFLAENPSQRVASPEALAAAR